MRCRSVFSTSAKLRAQLPCRTDAGATARRPRSAPTASGNARAWAADHDSPYSARTCGGREPSITRSCRRLAGWLIPGIGILNATNSPVRLASSVRKISSLASFASHHAENVAYVGGATSRGMPNSSPKRM